MKIIYMVLLLFCASFTTLSFATLLLKCNTTGQVVREGQALRVEECKEWSLCKEGGGPESCTTWNTYDPYARDELRDYLILHAADIAKRKAAGKTYIECPQKDGSLRCTLGYIVKECTAPKGGRCSTVLSSLGNTAICSASDGASCTAKMRLRLENLNAYHEQFKMGTQD